MTVTVDTKELAYAVKAAAAVTSGRLAECGWLHLMQHGDFLYVTGTNAEVWLTEKVKCSVEGEFASTAVSAGVLARLTTNLAGDTTKIVLDVDKLKVSSSRHSTRLGIAADLKKVLAAHVPVPAEVCAEWSGTDIARLKQMIPFASRDDNRPALQGLCLREGGAFVCDSYRMAMDTTVWPGEPAIIPANTLKYLVEESTEVSRSSIDVRFQSITRRVVTRLTEAEYPDIRTHVPEIKDALTTIRIENTSLWTAILRRMQVHVDDELSATYVEMETKDDMVLLTIPGVAEEVIEDQGYEGEPMFLGFNARYMLDFLDLANDLLLYLYPRRIRIDGDGYTGILMPINVNRR